MERRTAAAIALSVSATVLASGAAFAANLGLLDTGPDPVGRLEVSNVSELVPSTVLGQDSPSGTVLIDGSDDGTPATGRTGTNRSSTSVTTASGGSDDGSTTTVGAPRSSSTPTSVGSVGSVGSSTSTTLDDHGGDDDDDDHADDDSHEDDDDGSDDHGGYDDDD